jgi:hypothetical protein
MHDDTRSKEELVKEIEELQGRLARLEAERSDRAHAFPVSSSLSSDEFLRRDLFYELNQAPMPRRIGYESTESIELKSLFTRDVSLSGSFDVKGGIWATTFGKVLQALPIPAFLIDQYLHVAVANEACRSFTPSYERIQGRPFADLLGGPSSAEKSQSVLRRVFSDRKPGVCEGTLRIDCAVIWARMTFRAIRIMSERFVLLLVEDLTQEKAQLHENEILRRELEQRVEMRTTELRKTNENLRQEMAERRRAEQEREKVIVELQQALAHVKKLSGLLPICASCKKIRDDKGYWQQIEAYIRDHSEAEFSHGLCPVCAKKLYPELFD